MKRPQALNEGKTSWTGNSLTLRKGTLENKANNHADLSEVSAHAFDPVENKGRRKNQKINSIVCCLKSTCALLFALQEGSPEVIDWGFMIRICI